MCKLWYNKNSVFVGKLSEPSLVEGTTLLGKAAMKMGDLVVEKGIPFLANKGVEAGRYNAYEISDN